MLRTRAMGLCVEAYFQKHGTKMSWGLTELTPAQFKKAIKELDLSWADDRTQIDMIYLNLDHNENK